MNGMTAKELEKEKMTVARMCFELKAKRQVTLERLLESLGANRQIFFKRNWLLEKFSVVFLRTW